MAFLATELTNLQATFQMTTAPCVSPVPDFSTLVALLLIPSIDAWGRCHGGHGDALFNNRRLKPPAGCTYQADRPPTVQDDHPGDNGVGHGLMVGSHGMIAGSRRNLIWDNKRKRGDLAKRRLLLVSSRST
ncbi:hypothetical protein ZWY2020_010340 [Hordeum vulgare]|nr:hypothetical protein ZWY2020_010340 [Hordeum vulgare]